MGVNTVLRLEERKFSTDGGGVVESGRMDS
jgi:hypothetical protein